MHASTPTRHTTAPATGKNDWQRAYTYLVAVCRTPPRSPKTASASHFFSRQRSSRPGYPGRVPTFGRYSAANTAIGITEPKTRGHAALMRRSNRHSRRSNGRPLVCRSNLVGSPPRGPPAARCVTYRAWSVVLAEHGRFAALADVEPASAALHARTDASPRPSLRLSRRWCAAARRPRARASRRRQSAA